MRTHGAVVGRRFRSVTKLTTKVRIGRGYLWGRFLIAAAALKTPTRNGYNAQGVNLKFSRVPGRAARQAALGLTRGWYGGVYIAAAALKTPTRNGSNAQDGNLTSQEVRDLLSYVHR